MTIIFVDFTNRIMKVILRIYNRSSRCFEI